MPIVNEPAIQAEIAALHDAYERALAANDVSALGDYFWTSPDVVRYGVAEQLYGAEAIGSYRQKVQPIMHDRKLLRRTIVTVGNETASVMCEFSQNFHGAARHTRQSQVWVRFPEVGWKIVAAHVSNLLPYGEGVWEAYVEQAAKAVGLTLSAAQRAGVAANIGRTAAIAGPLLEFPLPPGTELAGVFHA